MGLTVATHSLADALASGVSSRYLDELWDHLREINERLADEGLPLHHEPTIAGTAAMRDPMGSVPSTFIHCLYHAYAHAYEDPDAALISPGDDVCSADDTAVMDAAIDLNCHLVLFWTASGFYVPIDFDEVLSLDDESALPGGFLGSSVALLRELTELAERLDIALVDNELRQDEIERILDDENPHPLHRERQAWLLLFEAAHVSVANGTVIAYG
ncbi:hypothetical protein IU486_28375 [Streptomyces gardneri]|uniref:hypothetical protein n=1 Tax=Nocardia sputi TaxID=2943705 RepID=UPI0018936471|nr:hypothetical protein [Nocardia sputi]MBF6168633.1 hypothetical protein [Streptomyces gardneri]MBF6208795.1 hypothetical protein [Streptomyces gardneri]